MKIALEVEWKGEGSTAIFAAAAIILAIQDRSTKHVNTLYRKFCWECILKRNANVMLVNPFYR